ncbi:MAG: tripartite tricarboxylate transporter TctB family protein [Geminicoccaceae bacterium]
MIATAAVLGTMTINPKLSILLELVTWLVLALAAFILSFQFSEEPGTYQWGAASWPRAVIGLMAFTACVHGFMRFKRAEVSTPAGDEEANSGGSFFDSLGLFLIPLVYAWLLPRTGFYLTTPFFLIAFLLYVGERRWRVILITTLIVIAVINLIFSKLFYVALPVGNWPGFYDINNWLLTAIR